MQIHELVLLSEPDDSGNVLAIDTGTKTYKITWSNLAKAVIESYNGSALNGSAQTLQAAIAELASDITTETGTLSSQITALDGSKAGILISTGTATALSDIPLNSIGRVSLSAADAPLGSAAAYNYVCFGNSSRVTLIASRPDNESCWVNYKVNSNWKGWTSELSASQALVTPSIFTPTNGTAWSNMGNCWYYKIGARVHVHIAVEGITANTNTIVVTLASGYRPYSVICAGGRGSNGSISASMYVTAAGSVSVRSEDTKFAGDIEFDAFN